MKITKNKISSIKRQLTIFNKRIRDKGILIYVEHNRDITVGKQGTSKWFGFSFNQIEEAKRKARELALKED